MNKQYANVLGQLKVGIKGAKELNDIKPLQFENLSFSPGGVWLFLNAVSVEIARFHYGLVMDVFQPSMNQH